MMFILGMAHVKPLNFLILYSHNLISTASGQVDKMLSDLWHRPVPTGVLGLSGTHETLFPILHLYSHDSASTASHPADTILL